MVRAGHRVAVGKEPEILLFTNDINMEYVVVMHACIKGPEGINCVTTYINPEEILRVAEEIKELERQDYAPAHPDVAIKYAEDVAREKLEELKRFKRSYSCVDTPRKGGPN